MKLKVNFFMLRIFDLFMVINGMMVERICIHMLVNVIEFFSLIDTDKMILRKKTVKEFIGVQFPLFPCTLKICLM